MKTFSRSKLALLSVVGLVLLSAAALSAANKYGKPKSVIHVVTIKWKEGTTPDQKKAAIEGVNKVAANYPGIKNIWTRAIKVQGKGYESALVMEFESEQALKDYTGSEAQKEWYKLYLPIREESTTHDITN